MERLQEKIDRMRGRTGGQRFEGQAFWRGPSSGNRAFDEYRNETLHRLEEEQQEFREFLNRLRHAKDKVEFDQFMSERRNRPAQPPQGEAPQHA
jgi:hypothetical protein